MIKGKTRTEEDKTEQNFYLDVCIGEYIKYRGIHLNTYTFKTMQGQTNDNRG